jgi:hypothetical protein
VELRDFFGGLAKSQGSHKRLRHTLALDFAEQPKLRMTRIPGPRAVAGGPAATARSGGNGSGAEIAQGEELLQQLGACGFQLGE